MPGIVGLITRKPRAEAERELQKMVAALRHESFYQTGTWIDESLGVYVGWVARQNSDAAAMPLSNESGDVVMVFAGEEFPQPGTALRLKERGHAVDVSGPSYLVHLYEEDPAFLENLNGRFHGLLMDRNPGTATLFNDRYGMLRLFYHEGKDAFYFAPEAKAILAVRPQLRHADAQSLGELVSLGCVLEDRTLFPGIRALPAGSTWVFENGAVPRKSTYFHPRQWEEQSPLEPEAYYEELREVLSRNLPRYFNGGERVGISLTGGLDTRVIMAWQKPAPGTLPAYTFGGPFRDCQDVLVARKVAGICGQSHQVITVADEFLSGFARYAERSIYLSEGSVDVYRSPDLYVSEKARAIAPVKIVGTYGSEIIRQSVMFKPGTASAGLFPPDFRASVDRAAETYAEVRRGHPVTFAAFRQSPWYHYGLLNLEQSQLTVRSPYLDNDFVRTVYRAPKSNLENGDVRLRLVKDGNPALARLCSDRGVGGDAGPLPAMAIRGFLEFTFKAEYAYDYGMPQWLSRMDDLVSPLRLERLFLGRHKFFHFRTFYKHALAGYVRQMLLDPKTLSRPYLEPGSVEAVVRGHLDDGRNYTSEIHKLLTLELIHRLFLDPQ